MRRLAASSACRAARPVRRARRAIPSSPFVPSQGNACRRASRGATPARARSWRRRQPNRILQGNGGRSASRRHRSGQPAPGRVSDRIRCRETSFRRSKAYRRRSRHPATARCRAIRRRPCNADACPATRLCPAGPCPRARRAVQRHGRVPRQHATLPDPQECRPSCPHSGSPRPRRACRPAACRLSRIARWRHDARRCAASACRI